MYYNETFQISLQTPFSAVIFIKNYLFSTFPHIFLSIEFTPPHVGTRSNTKSFSLRKEMRMLLPPPPLILSFGCICQMNKTEFIPLCGDTTEHKEVRKYCNSPIYFTDKLLMVMTKVELQGVNILLCGTIAKKGTFRENSSLHRLLWKTLCIQMACK